MAQRRWQYLTQSIIEIIARISAVLLTDFEQLINGLSEHHDSGNNAWYQIAADEFG